MTITHYNYITRTFDSNLSFTETGSLVYEIKANDVYEDFYKDKHFFHLINYPKDWKVFDPDNGKVIGKMKDESKGKINDELVGLKSKMHSKKNVDGTENKTEKEIN